MRRPPCSFRSARKSAEAGLNTWGHWEFGTSLRIGGEPSRGTRFASPMDGTSPLVVEARQAAKSVGLRYANDEQPGIRRKGVGKGFRYLDPAGKPVKDPKTLKRILSLAVPPAWTEVWICPIAEGHIQATGRDAKGRKQYRYHADFRAVREDGKYEHMLDFAAVLPQIRETVTKHMARRDLSRECVLATIVHLLETTLIRVGNGEYAKQNKSYGLTTLRDPHVKIEGWAI